MPDEPTAQSTGRPWDAGRLERRLLGVANRRRIVEHVGEHPGIHLRELARDLGLALGTVEHHVHLLVRHGLLEAHRFRRETCHYLPDSGSPEDRRLQACLRQATPRRLLRALLADPDPDVAALARRVQLTPAAVGRHLQHLAKDGLIERMRVGRATLLRPARPERLTAALGRIDGRVPPLPWPGLLLESVPRGARDRPTPADASAGAVPGSDLGDAALRSSMA